MTNDQKEKYLKTMCVGTCKDYRLVGHVPIKLTFLFCKFIEKRNNQTFAKVNGRRKLENSLVVPSIMQMEMKSTLKHFKKR